MYKKIIILLLLLPFFTIAQIQLRIVVDIRGRICNGGMGLCSSNKLLQNSLATTFIHKSEVNTLIMTFDKQTLTKQEEISIAGKEFNQIVSFEKISFIQNTDLVVDLETLKSLNLNPLYNIIKKGNYPMSSINEKVMVTFKLSEQ